MKQSMQVLGVVSFSVMAGCCHVAENSGNAKTAESSRMTNSTTAQGTTPSLQLDSAKEESGLKEVFAAWAGLQTHGLRREDRATLFRWQFEVCEKENRPWQMWMKACYEKNRRADYASLEKKFQDFGCKESAVADHVLAWYRRVTSLGYEPDVDDEKLYRRAQNSRSSWMGGTNLSVSRDKIMCKGDVREEDIRKAWEVSMNRLGAIPEKCDIVLDEPTAATVDAVCNTFADSEVRRLTLVGTRRQSVSMASVSKLSKLRGIELQNCKINEGGALAACESLISFSAADCELGALLFLTGCQSLRELSLERCSFSGLDGLWTARDLQTLKVVESERPVDLAELRRLSNLRSLDLSRSQVFNFKTVGDLPHLRNLTIDKTRGIDSLLPLARRELFFRYDKNDFDRSVWAGYERTLRRERCKNDPKKLLEASVEEGDVEEVLRIVRENGEVDATSAFSDIPVSGGFEMVKALAPKVSAKCLTERVVRCLRDDGEHADEVAYLLEQGADANASGGRWNSPLLTAVEKNNEGLVELLLRHGAKPGSGVLRKSLSDPFGRKGEERLKIAELLLKHGADVEDREGGRFGRTTLLYEAVGDGGSRRPDLKLVGLLLKYGADVNANCGKETILWHALNDPFGNKGESVAVVAQMLLEKGANVKDGVGDALLFDSVGDFAGDHCNPQTVGMLLQHGANAKACVRGVPVLLQAVKDPFGRKGTNVVVIVKMLLEHGADSNATGQNKSVLGEVLSEHPANLEVVRLLLANGADPNLKCGNLTPMDWAVRQNQSQKILDLLVKYGGKMPDSNKVPAGRRSRVRHDVRSDAISQEMERFRKEMDDFHRQRREGGFDHERLRHLHEEHHRRLKELQENRK